MASWYPGQKAQEIADRATKKYKLNLEKLKNLENKTNQSAQEYGEFQLKIIVHTVQPIINYMISIGQNVSKKERQLLEGYDFSVKKLKKYQAATVTVQNLLQGGLQAGLAGAAAYGGAFSAVTSIGAASTGTAISTLSGAAAWNATLAWFGGGAIAAGGGGMALGSLVLGSITIVPALGVAAWIAKSQGEKALTKATKYEADVNKAIAEMNAAKDVATRINKRIEELKTVLDGLSKRSLTILNQLQEDQYQSKTLDIDVFKELMLLTKAIVQFLETPVLNEEGSLNNQTVTILERYRPYLFNQFSQSKIITCDHCGQKTNDD